MGLKDENELSIKGEEQKNQGKRMAVVMQDGMQDVQEDGWQCSCCRVNKAKRGGIWL